LTCLANQQWSLVKGKCQRVQCSRPAIKGAAVVRIGDSTSASFHAGDRVAISCNPGRRHRSGSAILTCQSDGVWSGQPPACESACDGHCLNGGQCSSVPARRCTCPVGYSGDRCQHGKWHRSLVFSFLGDCMMIVHLFVTFLEHCRLLAHCILPCLYGGTCVAPYRCACRPGRGGLRCEKRMFAHLNTCTWNIV
jgi:Sushi repeat (SCR repeat)